MHPNKSSHSDLGREQAMNIQTSGIQRAPVKFGLSGMSRRKRKTMKPSVKSVATGGGMCVRGRAQKPDVSDARRIGLLSSGCCPVSEILRRNCRYTQLRE